MLGAAEFLKTRVATHPLNRALKRFSQWWQTVGLSDYQFERSNLKAEHTFTARRAYDSASEYIDHKTKKV